MDDNQKITSRLDTIIILLLSILQKNEISPKLPAMFNQLKNLGLSNEEISKISGKTPNQVAKISYEFKRPVKKEDKKK